MATTDSMAAVETQSYVTRSRAWAVADWFMEQFFCRSTYDEAGVVQAEFTNQLAKAALFSNPDDAAKAMKTVTSPDYVADQDFAVVEVFCDTRSP